MKLLNKAKLEFKKQLLKDFYSLRAFFYYTFRKFDKQQEQLELAIDIRPEDFNVFYKLINIYTKKIK